MIEYGWTDKAIQAEIGERFKHLRLDKNITLELLASRTLISVNTLKALEKGRAKLETMIIVLRELGVLQELNNFIAPIEISPIQLIKMQGKKRRRARPAKKRTEQTEWTDEW
jgi:putative transcriptional regulator